MPRKLRRNFVLILAGLFTSFAFAPNAHAQAGAHSSRLEIIQDKPFVMVMVNGKGPFRFLIDTGTAGEAFISKELAAQLALPQSGHITLHDPSGLGGQKVPSVVVDSLQVAGVEFNGVKAAVLNLGIGEGACQGLLGFALFRNYLLTLDYPNRRIALTPGDLEPDGERSVLPFRMPEGVPIVALSIGNLRIDAQLDSGGSGLSVPLRIASQLKFSSRFDSLSNAHTLSTRFELIGAKLAVNVNLGPYTFKRPFVEINPAFPLANFGSSPMQGLVLTFDQKNRLVRINGAQKTLHLSAPTDSMRLQNAPDLAPADPSLVPVG